MTDKKKPLTRADVILTAVILLAGVGLLAARAASPTTVVACIYLNGELTHEIELSTLADTVTIELNGVTLDANRDGICFVSSDCPDKLCVKAGVLAHGGSCMACVPNGVVVALKGSRLADSPHAVSY